MKEYVLLVFCLSLFSLPALAQIPRGSSLVGGSISGSYQESTYEVDLGKRTATSLSISPRYGLFVIKNLCAGLSASVGFDHDAQDATASSSGFTSNGRDLGVGPFVRYYVPLSEKIYAFGSASFSVDWMRYTSEEPLADYEVKYNTTSWGLGGGLSYFLRPNAALELGLGYNHDHEKVKQTSDTGYNTALFERVGAVSASIGLTIFFRRGN